MSTLTRLFVCFLVSILVPAIYADVNPDGSFSHTIPIEIPAGRNGLQPKLALTYNSNGGNGIIGVGWSLSGLPAITRMNFGNGINYGRAGFPADTYVGPEGRLIALGSGTGIYHTETESWSKYEAIGNCGNGPCSWKVTDRNGLVYHYGLTTNSRIIAKDANNNDINSGAVRVWALERVEDLNGNYYEITYKKDAGLLYDNGQYYPEKISYTLGNSVSKNYAISFFYDETGRPDKEISYAQSAYVKTNWRLSKIAVDYQSSCFLIFTCSDRIRSYQAEFEAISNSNQSQLTRWQEYDAANLTLPPKIINWPADSVNYASKPETTLAGTISTDSSNRFLVGDFNGDGKTDMAWLFPYGGNTIVRTSYATTTGYSQWTEWMWGGSISVSDQIATGDFDGDGKTDIVWLFAYNGDTKVRAAISTGISYFARPEVTLGGAISNDPSNRFLIGDFDADGKSDLAWLFPYNGNTIVRTSISTGTSFGSWYEWVWSGAINNTDQIATGDFDGDGKTDLVWLFAYNSNTKVRTAISKGNTFTTWAEATLGGAISNDSSNRFFVSDFNGDGKSDLAWLFPQNGNTYVRTSHCTGVSFLPWTEQALPGSIAASDKIFSPDLNRDGKSDILWLFALNGNSYIRTSLASSAGFSGWSETIWNGSISGDNYVIPLTTTGKTNPDIIWLFAFNGDTKVRTVSPTTSRASLISSISENSAVQSVEYESAIIFAGTVCPTPCTSPDSSSLTYTNGIPNASPRYVVTQVTTASNMDLDGAAGNDTFTTNYEYYNGRMTTGTISERTSLGFEKIKTIDAATNNYKIDTYRQDKPFHGRPVKTASYLANGSKISETTFPALAQYYCDETGCNTYNTVPIATPTQPQQIRPKIAAQLSGGELSSTTATSFENGIAYATKTEEVLAFDAYGNAFSARQTIEGNGATRSTYKFAQYINDTATGRTIGLPFNEKVCLTPAACAANDSNFVSESNTYFDNNATTGVIGSRKLVTKKESYLSTGVGTGIWVPETFTYDALGNVTQKVDAQGITTAIAYDTDYRQYPVSVTRSHGSATSLMTYTYDYRFGKKLTETNHDDNLITIYSVDASGFVTGQQTQNGATILAKKSYAHSPFGTSPIWTQECTFYGATFTTTACRKKFTDSLGRVYREEFPELVAGVETPMAVEHRYLPAQNGVCSGATTPTTIIKRDLVSKPKPSSTTTEDFHTSFSSRSFPGEWSEHCFDELNRAKQTRTHDNKTTSSNYQNAGTSATTGLPASGSVACTVNTDVDGVKKRSCTDIGGKPSAVSEAYTSATETTVNYGYDALNRLTSVSSPQGVTTITYVGRSQLQESIIDPVVGTTSYEYYLTPGQGDFTKLKKETRPASAGGTTVTDLEYAATFGRVSKTTKADAVTTYIYDETDLSYGKGRLTTMAHTVDGYTIQDRYSYNDRGETTNTTRRISHATETLCSNVNAMPCLQTFGSTKDELGRVKTMTYPDGKVSTVNYLPGSGKNVSSLTHDGITYASYSNYTFDVTSHVGKVTYGNGVEHAYTYEPDTGLLSTTVIGKPASPAYIDLAYEYNPNLNIGRITDHAIPFLSVSYQYDALNRLSTATWDPDGTEITRVKTYQFDNHGAAMSKGNLTRKDQRRLTYAAGKTYPVSDELWNEGASQWQANATYAWSANGNLVTKGPFTFTYDSNNMMKQAVEVDPSTGSGLAQTNFFYDQSGQRFMKKHTRGGVTIKTWYLGDGIEIREKYVGVTAGTPDGTYDSSQSTKYIYGIDNKRLASITGTVYTAALSVSSSSMYALADGHSSSTVSGIAGKVYYTFYGAYAHVSSFAHDLNHGQMRIIALALVGLMLLVWLVLTHPLSPSLKKRGGSTTSPLPMGEGPGVRVALWQRTTALGMVFAFFTVNCGLQLPSGVTQGQVNTLISDLYTGLPAGTVYYSHNHLGSGALVTDAAGNEVFRITYTEYGEIDLANSGVYNPGTTNIEHTVDDAKIFITAVKYTGQEYDPETGMYYYNARYYDPQLGVFTTADRKFDRGAGSFAFNRHMYVSGNPIMYADPSGHFIAFLIPALVVLGKVAAGALAGAAIGGAVSATIRAGQHGWDFKNNWGSIGQAFGTGAAIGAITGAAGVIGGMVGSAAANGTNSAFGQAFARHFMGKLTSSVLSGGGVAAYRGENILEGIGRGFASGYIGGIANGLGFGAIGSMDTGWGGTLASSAIDGTLQFGASVATQSMLNPNAPLNYGAMFGSSMAMAFGRGALRAFTHKQMGAKFEDNKRYTFGEGHDKTEVYADSVREQGINSLAARYRRIYDYDGGLMQEGHWSMDGAAMAGGNGISQIHDAMNSAAYHTYGLEHMETWNYPLMLPAAVIAQNMDRNSFLNLSKEHGY